MGFEPKPAPAGDINQVSEVAAALNRRASGFNHSANVCTVPCGELKSPAPRQG